MNFVPVLVVYLKSAFNQEMANELYGKFLNNVLRKKF